MATAKTIATSTRKTTPAQRTARNISVRKQPMQERTLGSVNAHANNAKPHVEESQAEKKARKDRIKARHAARK